MQPILVAYATTEGQTRKIAEFIAERLRIRGHRVDIVDTSGALAKLLPTVYGAVILGGSVHEHKHPESLRCFIADNLAWLGVAPCAFFSVSLTAALTDLDSRIESQVLLNEFMHECKLKPVTTCCVAGALRYTRYNYFKRLIMRLVAQQRGKSADASHDHEYTDWDAVEAFVDEFLAAANISHVRQTA